MGEIVDALRRADEDDSAKDRTRREAPSPAPPQAPARPSVRDVLREHSPGPAAPVNEPTPEAHASADPAPSSPRSPLALDRLPDPNWKVARTALCDPHGDATQQFRRLAFRTRDVADARNARSIVVTSAQMGDGKTTTICNLAVQMARLDRAQRVVLVDLDLRRPSIASALGIQPDVSIDEVLRGERSLDDALFETDVDGLSVVTLRDATEDPESLLSHPNLAKMIHDLEDRFDRVLIDTPPVLAVTDVQLILRHAAAGIFVARAGRTTVKGINRALELLPMKKLLGSFLNASPNKHTRSGYQYYREAPETEIQAAESSTQETTQEETDAADGR